jgi:hypothetical protein
MSETETKTETKAGAATDQVSVRVRDPRLSVPAKWITDPPITFYSGQDLVNKAAMCKELWGDQSGAMGTPDSLQRHLNHSVTVLNDVQGREGACLQGAGTSTVAIVEYRQESEDSAEITALATDGQYKYSGALMVEYVLGKCKGKAATIALQSYSRQSTVCYQNMGFERSKEDQKNERWDLVYMTLKPAKKSELWSEKRGKFKTNIPHGQGDDSSKCCVIM